MRQPDDGAENEDEEGDDEGEAGEDEVDGGPLVMYGGGGGEHNAAEGEGPVRQAKNGADRSAGSELVGEMIKNENIVDNKTGGGSANNTNIMVVNNLVAK